MASFSREEFGLRSKSELLDYIEQQSEQISRLETRFRGEPVAVFGQTYHWKPQFLDVTSLLV